jgi:diacylglycerol O-acyltransferase
MDRLSGLDASFLYFETPNVHMHVTMVAVLDPSGAPGGYSFPAIVELIASRLHLLPPFRRRIVRAPLDLHHPVWVEDPDFDIHRHVRRVSCPAPGGPHELAAICGSFNATPLDRSRPLWEVCVIEGLAGGRFAFMTKVHHCAVDGVSGSELMVHLFGVERGEREAPVVAPAPRPPPERVPSGLEMVKMAFASRMRQPRAMVPLARRTASAVAEIVRRRRDPATERGATPLTAPRTRFNGAIGAERSVAFARVALKDAKAIRRAFGVTLNDVVLAVCAGALRSFLSELGELPGTPLIAVCPISVRSAGDSSSSNHLSAMFTSLATDVAGPVDRLRAIQSVTRGAKEEHHAIGADLLQNWAEFAAPTTFSLAARFYTKMKLADRHRPIHNLVISNVPGPQFPLYLAGSELVAAYPLGPVFEGAGLNVTVLSYMGWIDFGFNAATSAVPDLWELADAIAPALAELAEAAEHVGQDARATVDA